MKGYKAVLKTKKYGVFSTGHTGNADYTELKVGEIYEVPGKPQLCSNGFHFFEHLCFGINYINSKTVFLEVEALGEIKKDTFKAETIEGNRYKINFQETGKELKIIQTKRIEILSE